MLKLTGTDLDVYPICLGGNVFGWTADERESFDVLDAYEAAGGNFIDTADAYSAWVPGNSGGESETIIGKWMAARGNRDRMVIATKIGAGTGLAAATVAEKAEASLRRLGVETVDIMYAHYDDQDTPLEEALGALDKLVRDGKARYIAASNYSAARLREALAVSEREGFARFAALQTHYNLMERDYEQDLAGVVADAGISTLSYFSLAMGFLSGKYRAGVEVDSERAGECAKYLTDRGTAVLAALDEISAAHGAPLAAVALAWLRAQPTVSTPVSSARTLAQLADIVAAADLSLSADEVRQLTDASA